MVISPGSRNAPLTIGFTSNDSFSCYSVVDERCAAFFGLGMAQQLKQPVGLVCTSGSALLNYYPAIAEAFYSHVPLMVFSADRPEKLIDIGDGQTIRQENVYERHILYSANLKEGEAFQEYNEEEINKAMDIALSEMGPVHINLPFSEPLYDVVETTQVYPKPQLVIETPLWEEDLGGYIEKWNQANKKMILVGALDPNSIEARYIDYLSQDESVLVLTETLSNIHHPNFIPAIDQLITSLTDEEFGELQPDILLTFGGMIVSKRIKAFLRKYPPQEHWHVGPYSANDTFFILKKHFKTHLNQLFERFLPYTLSVASGYQSHWLEIKHKRLEKHQSYIKEVPFSDFRVYDEVFQNIPNGYLLHLANSTAVRYSQLFDSNESWEVFCNRGTSGIDGSTSTALGAAVASGKPTVLVTGDLSFFYDSNALWNGYVPKDVRIVLVNNSGGGIFRILPKAKEVDHFERFFETRHDLTAKPLCELYHWDYSEARNEQELKHALAHFFEESDRPKLLEVHTPPTLNDTILKGYFKHIA